MVHQVLCVGQSDSCAGTGIQADIKTIQAFGGYATTAVTAVSVQNTKGVQDVQIMPGDIVAKQIAAIMDDMSPDVIKIGNLANEEVINVIGGILETLDRDKVKIVVDPVMTNRSGRVLLDKGARDALKRVMLIYADVLTPNQQEAETLTGMAIRDTDEMCHAAEMLRTLGAGTVILKGGSLFVDGSREVVFDVLADAQNTEVYHNDRMETKATHGAGTTLSAGIAIGMAEGMSVRDSYVRSRSFMNRAIAEAEPIGAGFGPLNHCVSAATDKT